MSSDSGDSKGDSGGSDKGFFAVKLSALIPYYERDLTIIKSVEV